jgi:hypothetical protein
MLIQPVDYFLLAWFTLALGSTLYVGWDQYRNNPLRRLLVERQREALTMARDDRSRSLGFSLSMFEHARDHRDHYRALVGSRGGTVSLGTIRKILSQLVRDELTATADKNPADVIPRELVVQYVVGAYMAVMTWWLDGGTKLPPHRIDAMFRRLATQGILRRAPEGGL